MVCFTIGNQLFVKADAILLSKVTVGHINKQRAIKSGGTNGCWRQFGQNRFRTLKTGQVIIYYIGYG